MVYEREHNRFEWLVLVIVVGIIMLVAIVHYIDLARDGRRAAFGLLANNFASAVAMARVEWLLQHAAQSPNAQAEPHTQRVFMNEAGWPVATLAVNANNYSAQNCYQLWEELLQNPAPATVQGGAEQRGERQYHISFPQPDICRYELITDAKGHYFDYNLLSGKVSLQVPPPEHLPEL